MAANAAGFWRRVIRGGTLVRGTKSLLADLPQGLPGRLDQPIKVGHGYPGGGGIPGARRGFDRLGQVPEPDGAKGCRAPFDLMGGPAHGLKVDSSRRLQGLGLSRQLLDEDIQQHIGIFQANIIQNSGQYRAIDQISRNKSLAAGGVIASNGYDIPKCSQVTRPQAAALGVMALGS